MSGYIAERQRIKREAEWALASVNEGNKKSRALEAVKKLNESFVRSGKHGATALCMIYNATGGTLNLVTDHNFRGHKYDVASTYPTPISNGSWAYFLHVEDNPNTGGCSGGVVYRPQTDSTVDVMLAWETTGTPLEVNKAYTEVRKSGLFQGINTWHLISNVMTIMKPTKHNSTLSEIISYAKIEQESNNPIFQAIVTQVGLNVPT